MNQELNNEAVPMLKRVSPKIWLSAGLLAVCAGGAAMYTFGDVGGSASAVNPISDAQASSAANASQASAKAAITAVAKVDGQTVSELEISNLIGAGVDRAIAVDRYINKVIAAEMGKKLYQQESESLVRAAEREVLATLYTNKRLEELRKAVSAEDIKSFYGKNVLDDNYKQWRVSYYLTTEAKDMESTLAKMKEGDKEALKQLRPLAEQGDNFLLGQAMPYNLGRVVSKMKKGEFSEVLRLRNGLLVVKVEDLRQVDKPKLEAVQDEIREALAQQRFNEELEQARKRAKVELS